MGKTIRRFLLAFSFLTVLPFSLDFFSKGKENKENKEDKESINIEFSRASIFFPLVGLLMGGILLACYKLFIFFNLPSILEAGFILAVWIILSGGLHLEGLADMVDGFSGGENKEDIIRIMKDGSIGAKGAIALIILILLKYLLLLSLAKPVKGISLLLAPMMGRWTMVLTGYLGQPASPSNTLTQIFTQYLGRKELLISTLFTFMVSFSILSFPFLYLTGLCFIITAGMTGCLIVYSNRKIKGICGDVIGAVNEINELLILVLFLFFNT